MKERVINTLKVLLNSEKFDLDEHMARSTFVMNYKFQNYFRKKSKQILMKYSHNYGALTISTIDKFNSKLIRTFAQDLKLNSNFEVELDTNYFLDKTIDRLLQKTDDDKNI